MTTTCTIRDHSRESSEGGTLIASGDHAHCLRCGEPFVKVDRDWHGVAGQAWFRERDAVDFGYWRE